MATLEAIQTRIKKLEAQAQALKAKASSGVIKQIHGLMARHRISIDDVTEFFNKASAKTKAKAVGQAVSAKYVDPKTGATWSGRGRAPAWIASASDRTAFLAAGANKSTARSKPSGKRRTAARKGPQPALYRDPVSGLTWSGFGRAPQWITSAKDRSALLIDKGSAAGTKNDGAQAVAKKGGAAKKSASKTTAAADTAKPTAKKAASTKAVAKKRAAAKTGPAAKKRAAAKKGAAASKGAVAKKGAAAKKGTAAKKVAKSAAAKRPRSVGTGPARKARGPVESVAPVETPAQSVVSEADNPSL
ncbi:H-NS family nucleoid-associated regulatory protein [Caballeronia sp. LZ035]|uniref:H-NS family nucleoid-associated regulatory protein n=1 Tax=Caballeronia sp. LZ035 TaxID=3038568 RepID=UPI0028630E71|nr:H-NS family nucleoid-associated regulatory protein [Caballeronia sp. LZ035]MDR5763436.1 H-NS family nucleoid-associated regulatory protein [Caballeronia sp. LZ035]